MLSIRLQRVGRKGHAVYRIIVQESHRQPTSGRIVVQLGTYDPHTKAVTLDKEKAQTYLNNGAQPTPRVISLFTAEKIKLPGWVITPSNKKQKSIKNAEKLRRNQPKEEAPAEMAEEEATTDAVVEEVAESEVSESQSEAPEEVAQSAEEAPEEKTTEA